MLLTTIGTGSAGNCNVIKLNNKYIVLDCGLQFEEITHSKNFPSFKDISFVWISHSHHDHNKSMKEFKTSGCTMLTYEMLEQKVQHFNIDNFDITTFPVNHNVENYGIIIKDIVSRETFCYVTDFNKIPKIEGVTHWLYEINYIEKDINGMIDAGKYDKFKHTNFTHHNSLEYAIQYFTNLKTRPKEIIICHLSSENASAKRILEAMKPFADTVKIARK